MTSQLNFRLLVVRCSALGELEVDALAGEALIDFRVGVQPVVNATTLLLIKYNLEELATILLSSETLTDDLDGVDEVSEDSVVNGGECSGSRALLSLVGARAVRTLGTRENAARGDEENVTVRELLLKLTGQAMKVH